MTVGMPSHTMVLVGRGRVSAIVKVTGQIWGALSWTRSQHCSGPSPSKRQQDICGAVATKIAGQGRPRPFSTTVAVMVLSEAVTMGKAMRRLLSCRHGAKSQGH